MAICVQQRVFSEFFNFAPLSYPGMLIVVYVIFHSGNKVFEYSKYLVSLLP